MGVAAVRPRGGGSRVLRGRQEGGGGSCEKRVEGGGWRGEVEGGGRARARARVSQGRRV